MLGNGLPSNASSQNLAIRLSCNVTGVIRLRLPIEEKKIEQLKSWKWLFIKNVIADEFWRSFQMIQAGKVWHISCFICRKLRLECGLEPMEGPPTCIFSSLIWFILKLDYRGHRTEYSLRLFPRWSPSGTLCEMGTSQVGGDVSI